MMRRAEGAKSMSSLSRKLFPPCETAIPRCLFRKRKSVEFWRVGGRRRPAAGTILPEPVKILESPAAEGIHADILGFPSLELQLKLGRNLNLELNRKCRGASSTQSGGNPFSGGEAVRAHIQQSPSQQ